MSQRYIAFSPPSIGPAEIAEVVDTLTSDWITTGPKTARFEAEFAATVGARAALAVSSATAAMQVALAAFGIRPGDEVITTTMTFCSTIHVIEHFGARPILVDVEGDTLCIDPGKVELAITENTKGILPVHLYGHPCDMDRLLELARRYSLFVLEDAAHAFPARYKGRDVGTLGQLPRLAFMPRRTSRLPKVECWWESGTSSIAHGYGAFMEWTAMRISGTVRRVLGIMRWYFLVSSAI